MSEYPLTGGEIIQIDYDSEHGHRITRICLRDPASGSKTEIRFTYPSPDWGDGLGGVRDRVVILPPERGPSVSVVRLS